MLRLVFQNIFLKWLGWYFVEVPLNILGAFKNFLWFGLNYFSIPLLLKTFFAPWRRYRWLYQGGFNLLRYFEVYLSNSFSRIIGAIARSTLIIIGVLVEFSIMLCGIFLLLGWILLPVFMFLAFCFGLRQILF